jgi:hypothetical protein
VVSRGHGGVVEKSGCNFGDRLGRYSDGYQVGGSGDSMWK